MPKTVGVRGNGRKCIAAYRGKEFLYDDFLPPCLMGGFFYKTPFGSKIYKEVKEKWQKWN